MPLSTTGPKRGRSLQLETLEDRKLLSTTTIRAHATGTFFNGPVVSTNPPAFITTIAAAGTTQGTGVVTALAHDTTTLSVHRRTVTVSFNNGSGTLKDSAGDVVVFTFNASGPFTSATRFKVSGTGTIVGGTGPFTGVSGRITAQGTADISTGTISLDLVARVKY